MSNVYHVNLETGETGPCRALKKCPFGGDEIHFTSESSAREAYEKHMSGDRPFALKKVVVTEDEERINRRINEGDLQNGDRVAFIEDGQRHLGSIIERQGGLYLLVPGQLTRPVNSALNDGKITSRFSGEMTRGEISEAIAKLNRRRRRLTKQESLKENEEQIVALNEQLQELIKDERRIALSKLEQLDDEKLAYRDKMARGNTYAATMSDGPVSSITRAEEELSLIRAEITRRREAAVAAGDKPYSDGTRPSQYSDDSGYTEIRRAGGTWDDARNEYRMKGGFLEVRQVDGRGYTFVANGSTHYAKADDAIKALSRGV